MTADEIKTLENIFDTKLDPLSKQLDRVEKRVEGLEEKVEDIDNRLERVEVRLGNVEDRLDSFILTTNGTLLVITETLNQLAHKDDIAALGKRVTV